MKGQIAGMFSHVFILTISSITKQEPDSRFLWNGHHTTLGITALKRMDWMNRQYYDNDDNYDDDVSRWNENETDKEAKPSRFKDTRTSLFNLTARIVLE